MPRTVEISEEDLIRRNKFQETVQTILANPKAKLLVQEATKLVYPNAVTPELDAVAARREETAGVSKEVEDLKAQIAKDKQEREDTERLRALSTNFESGFARLRQQGFTDAGVTEIRKIMEEKGILDHDIAAAYFEKQNPAQNLTTPRGGAWNFMEAVQEDDTDLKKLIEAKGENPSLLDKMARDALLDVRGQSRR